MSLDKKAFALLLARFIRRFRGLGKDSFSPVFF
jgi:hypothetical protein